MNLAKTGFLSLCVMFGGCAARGPMQTLEKEPQNLRWVDKNFLPGAFNVDWKNLTITEVNDIWTKETQAVDYFPKGSYTHMLEVKVSRYSADGEGTHTVLAVPIKARPGKDKALQAVTLQRTKSHESFEDAVIRAEESSHEEKVYGREIPQPANLGL